MLHDLVPDRDSLLRGEETQEAHGGRQHYAVSKQRLQPRLDSVVLETDLLSIILDALKDVLGPHVRNLGNFDLLAELSVPPLHSLQLFLQLLQPQLLFANEAL